MKIIQLPYCFYPDPISGTEVFVELLSKQLQKWGIESIICAPTENASEDYVHNDLRVRRFNISKKVKDLSELYGEGNVCSAIEFGKILEEEKPDLIHLHAFTRACSLRLVNEIKKRNIPIVFTCITPNASCQRGSLMLWGQEVCDGRLYTSRCSSCVLHGLGVNKIVSIAIGSLPSFVGRLLGNLKFSGGVWTALRMTQLIRLRHASFQTLMREVDYIIVTCEWLKSVLVKNRVPSEKISIVRFGLYYELPNLVSTQPSIRNQEPVMPLRIAFLGRLHPVKGVDILMRAIKSIPSLYIELYIYGIIQGSPGDAYLKKLKTIAEKDRRIIFKESVPHDQVIELLRNFDLLAVPSQWLETGPIVVLDAFAAGIPVIGSNRAGIAESVKHEVNGLLVEPASVKAWSRELQRLCKDRRLLMRLRTSVRPPRKMEEMAKETRRIYCIILEKRFNQQGA